MSEFTLPLNPNDHVFKELKNSKPNIRLLCTQATERCSKAIGEQKTIIAQMFSQKASSNGIFYNPVQGCPCAGTVIIELGQSVKVIQPSEIFHKEIIQNYQNHQCIVSSNLT